MTEEAQRITIAEACGWRNLRYAGMIHPKPLWGTHKTDDCHPPDYLNDLNALHDAEKMLTGVGKMNYVNTLFSRFDEGQRWDNSSTRLVFFPFICATAEQRAEAFLKTIGKWTE